MLFTSDDIAAAEALQFGIVNKVVPRESLETEALAMAQKIARKSRLALKLTKKAINSVQDAQSRELAMTNAFHTCIRSRTRTGSKSMAYAHGPDGAPRSDAPSTGTPHRCRHQWWRLMRSRTVARLGRPI